jgi:hypothetical protein
MPNPKDEFAALPHGWPVLHEKTAMSIKPQLTIAEAAVLSGKACSYPQPWNRAELAVATGDDWA